MAKGINKYEGMSEDMKRMLRGEPLIRREDYLCSEEQDQIDQLEHRIADLERERALLLRFAKATNDIMPDVSLAHVREPYCTAWYEASQAVCDAGLLGGDDTAAARQEAGE